jgi:hypothetical protein
MNVNELMGKKLTDFTIEEYTEVYITDVDGFKVKSIIFLKDGDIAKTIAEQQAEFNYVKTDKILILTNGKIGFLLGELITIMDDEQAIFSFKFSLLEKKALGL